MSKSFLLVKVLRSPSDSLSLSALEWDLLIRQARVSNLLARLEFLFTNKGLLEKTPKDARKHLDSAAIVSNKQAAIVTYEAKKLQESLAYVDCKVVILKGAAYVLAGLMSGKGRIFSDIDIIVPKEQIKTVEEALEDSLWRFEELDSYDERYYRNWMHEIPPMIHLVRKTVLDVHHNILPETGRLYPDPAKFFTTVRKLKDRDLWVFSSEDMVLHSAAHLFHDGELDQGLRDLSDLDLLMKEFSVEEGFWKSLLARAVELNLQRPLFYALRYTNEILKTPIPDDILKSSEMGSPGTVMVALMDALFLRALAPDHPSCDDRWTGLARWMLFIRSHWLRMPPLQLAQHLARKGYKRWRMRNNIA
jgi:hypothetical protein